MSLSDRISDLKSENKLTTEKLAQLSGVPKGTINKILNGETQNPTARTLRRLALALGCAPDSLYESEDEGSRAMLREDISPELDCVPVYPRTLPVYCDYFESDKVFPTPAEAMLNCDFALRITEMTACDDSMCEGDYAFIKRQSDVEDGQIAAVRLNGKLALMRIHHASGQNCIIAQKKGDSPRIVYNHDKSIFEIVGRAIAIQHLI